MVTSNEYDLVVSLSTTEIHKVNASGEGVLYEKRANANADSGNDAAVIALMREKPEEWFFALDTKLEAGGSLLGSRPPRIRR